LGEFGCTPESATLVYCDNEAAVRISKDTVCHSRTKHVSLSFWFVREHQEAGNIAVKSISTREQLADFLTKPLNKPTFDAVVQLTGLTPAPNQGSKKGE